MNDPMTNHIEVLRGLAAKWRHNAQGCGRKDQHAAGTWRSCARELDAALAALGGEQDWQPIETAPKDGARILVYSPVDGIMSSHYEGGCWQNTPWRAGAAAKAAMPTHWMPLPPPPAQQHDQQGDSHGDA